jgi:hypothetical protein
MSRMPVLPLLEQLDLFFAPPEPPSVAKPDLSLANGRGPRHQPQGDVYDIQEYFDAINRIVFKGVLAPCPLRWSRNRWRLTLGLCDVKKRVITLNCSLDDARVPEVVVAQVIHHEMLHLYFGIAEGPNGTRRFHTPQFRLAEKAFPGYKDAQAWVNTHWPMRGRPAKRTRPADQGFLAYLALMVG